MLRCACATEQPSKLGSTSRLASRAQPSRLAPSARTITQGNAACVYNGHGGLDGAEILGHEIGHTLGFGHSCEGGTCVAGSVDDDALMRSHMHRDGRGASPRIDDRAVASIVYPAPGAGLAPSIFLSGFELR